MNLPDAARPEVVGRRPDPIDFLEFKDACKSAGDSLPSSSPYDIIVEGDEANYYIQDKL